MCAYVRVHTCVPEHICTVREAILKYRILHRVLVGMGVCAGKTKQFPGVRLSSLRAAKNGEHQNGCWSGKLSKPGRVRRGRKPPEGSNRNSKLKKQKAALSIAGISSGIKCFSQVQFFIPIPG